MTVGPASLTASPPLCSFQEGLQLCEVYSASLLPAPRVAQVFCLPLLSGSRTVSAQGQGHSVPLGSLCGDCWFISLWGPRALNIPG